MREKLVPDFAEFIIGPAEGRTCWLRPGYGPRKRGDGEDGLHQHLPLLRDGILQALRRIAEDHLVMSPA
jgi:hypothetical protein